MQAQPACSPVFDSELDRGLDGWNTLDTDNTEKKDRQQTREEAPFLLPQFPAATRQAVFPPCKRRGPAVDVVAVFVESVKSVESVIKLLVPSRGVLANSLR
jgi:hypothetical protein